MQKWTAGCLLGMALLVFVSAGCFVGSVAGEKHTGPVTVRNDAASELGAFEFIRPNGEIFEMLFDPHYLEPQIHKGDVLSDLVYTDQKYHQEFFVKATLVKEFIAPPEPVVDEVLYRSVGIPDYSCTGNGGCVQLLKFYRWKDGGYRDKPESPRRAH